MSKISEIKFVVKCSKCGIISCVRYGIVWCENCSGTLTDSEIIDHGQCFEINKKYEKVSKTKRTTGCKDLEGNEIFDGSIMQHPDGKIFVVIFNENRKVWNALYDDGTKLLLGLQIGDRGLAVVIG